MPRNTQQSLMNKGLSKVIDITRSLKESPTMSVGDGGFTNSATASGPVSGYDVPLPLPDLSQDYQTPGESGLAKYRFSNVYPVEKVTEKNIDSMVDASNEYLQLADKENQRNAEERINRILKEDQLINIKENNISFNDTNGITYNIKSLNKSEWELIDTN